MAHIFSIGETVYDIIFNFGGAISRAVPGGSMLNTSVSLGRLKLPVYLITEFGNDTAGKKIMQFLKENGVRTNHIRQYNDGKTAISLAFLDQNKDASYSFYKDYPEKRMDATLPEFCINDYLLFGSFFSLQKEIRTQLMKIVNKAVLSDALIVYDPNIRNPHKSQIDELMPFIRKNISMSDIVRASDEDFRTIFNINDPQSAYSKVKELGCSILIYTNSNKDVSLFTPQVRKTFKVPQITPLSTIGAGDSFNAGIIYSLFTSKINKAELTGLVSEYWDKIIDTSIQFSTDVCLSKDNYVSKKFAENLSL